MCRQIGFAFVCLFAISSSALAGDPTPSAAPGAAGEIDLLFTYGSEKKTWIDAATAKFHEKHYRISSGEEIRVKADPMGSGEIIDELLAGSRQVHLVSPAASAYFVMGNAASSERSTGDLVGEPELLVKSPIIIAIWSEMAEAIGWPGRRIHWRGFFDHAREPSEWQQESGGRWGAFKYGHTHPDHSNSGLHAILIEAYAGLGKFENVRQQELATNFDSVSRYVREVEQSVVHYGRSTGFLSQTMQEKGRTYLSAVILYENLVIEQNQKAKAKGLPVPQVVAVYPAEGTFVSDHPVGVVKRPWVTPRHDEAAKIYIKFLLSHDIQVMAKASGFRPALSVAEIPIDDMLTKERGVDPKEPKRILQSPPNSAINFIQKIWRENKRPSDIVLAIDISGSMKDDDKILHARKAAEEFIKLLGEVDYLSIALFGIQVEWLIQDLRMDDKGKQAATDAIKQLATGGDTALYYSIKVAHDYLQKRPRNRARAVVVLSDGDDTKAEKGDAPILIDPETNRKVRSPSLEEILNQIKNDGENNTIFIYTIGYGTKANKDILSKIAAASRADYYEGRPEDIKKLLSVLANHF